MMLEGDAVNVLTAQVPDAVFAISSSNVHFWFVEKRIENASSQTVRKGEMP